LVTAFAPLDLEALLAPLDARQPVGIFDEEDNTYQGIDREMIKLGSLQETKLDWSYVDEASRLYLSQQCKHFRIAVHLSMARLRSGGWRGWAEAAGVLAGMVSGYWEDSYPKPGPAGLSAKRRLLSLQIERLGGALAALDAKSFAEEYYKAGQQALDQLQACAAQVKLDVAVLTRLESQFAQQAEATRAPDLAEARQMAPVSSGSVLTEAFFKEASFQAGNERENRRTLLALAEFINHQDAYDPTGYLLRRFALWAHLGAAPGARKGNCTELMAVSVDTAEAYADALKANAVDPVLLQRIEKSVSSSPYWLRGSYLAAGVARRLEMPLVAEAIRQATQRFIARLPALTELQFADGRAFVDGDTLAWIGGEGAGATTTATGHEYSALREELHALLEREGVEAMLRRLEAVAQEASHLRHRCHVIAMAGELLGSRGLAWLADGLYARAHAAMRDATAREWEPDFFHLLEQQASSAPGRNDK